tara:strand:- start:452 stop:628 length:177 start_codon:yes stop_codon:yes gene_type:complete
MRIVGYMTKAFFTGFQSFSVISVFVQESRQFVPCLGVVGAINQRGALSLCRKRRFVKR